VNRENVKFQYKTQVQCFEYNVYRHSGGVKRFLRGHGL